MADRHRTVGTIVYWRALIVIGVDGANSHGVGGLVIVLLVVCVDSNVLVALGAGDEVDSFTIQMFLAYQQRLRAPQRSILTRRT